MKWSELWRFERGDAGIIAPGPWLWLRTLLWMALLFACATLAFFASFQGPDWFRLPPGSDYVCAIFLPALAVLLYGLAVRFAERRPASEFALRAAPVELPFGFLLGFAFISLVLLLLWALNFYIIGHGHWRHWYNYFIFNAYISAVLEELAFRAILLRLTARVFGPVTGLIVSAVLFGAAHAGHASPVAAAQIVVAGLIFGLLYMQSGRLWLSIGAHLGYDFTEWSLMGVGDKNGLLVVIPAPHAPAFLTGGGFGPDGSVFTTLVGSLFIIAIVAVGASRRGRRT
jgi:membrane protease YdiL (CAAX protease family)